MQCVRNNINITVNQPILQQIGRYLHSYIILVRIFAGELGNHNSIRVRSLDTSK